MVVLYGPRGTGKTKKLFQIAQKENAMILTGNSRALREKAHSYGFDDIEIIDYKDLRKDNFSFCKSLLIDNVEEALTYLFNRYYNIQVRGFTATEESYEF